MGLTSRRDALGENTKRGRKLAIGEDLIWEGRDVETVLGELSKVSNAISYGDLVSGKYEYSNNDWFMEGN